MPLTCTTTTTTTNTTTMTTESSRNDSPTDPIPSQPPTEDQDAIIDFDFDESQCLFCNQIRPDMDINLLHMSKTHGLHIDTTNPIVDVISLLAYFHLVISGCYECLYCGTQRNTLQAVQQHMMAKGHCKYDVEERKDELRDFYELSSSEEDEEDGEEGKGVREGHQNLPAIRLSEDGPRLSSKVRSRRPRASKRGERQGDGITTSLPDETQPSPNPTLTTPPDSHSTTDSTNPQNALTPRAARQESTLHNQLSHLRASDRRNLIHLPSSQQRALLATYHKQMEKAGRTEQAQRGHLETAANKTGGLGKIRLVRQPPHFGHVVSLNR